jgi:hypothetical protein
METVTLFQLWQQSGLSRAEWAKLIELGAPAVLPGAEFRVGGVC